MWWLYNENRQFCPCSLRIYFCQSIIPAGSRDYRFLNPGSGIGKRDPGLQSLLSTHYRLRPYPVIVAIRPRTHGSSSPHLASSSAMTILPTLTSATSLPIGLPSWSWDWTRLIMLIRLLPTIRSLERRARYLFYCMFFCFFCSVNDFSATRGPIRAKVCMRAYTGSGCVFSPFGG